MSRRGGVIRRDEALELVAAHVIDDAVRAGAIAVAHPGVYRLADADDLEVRRRAALAYCREGALSHTDALDVWRLPGAPSSRVHVTVGPHAAQLSRGLHLHWRRDHRPEPPMVVVRDGLRVVRLESAVVDSWSLLPRLQRRAPAIVAVRERRTTPARLLEALDSRPQTIGARDQRRLFTLLAAGNHSELEIWGHHNVFTDQALPPSVAQHRVVIGGQVFIFDRAFLEEMVAVELDGAAYHGSPGQRERDLRRDAITAQGGWLTVRYSHPRLHAQPAEVVDELAAILARRREQLRLSA